MLFMLFYTCVGSGQDISCRESAAPAELDPQEVEVLTSLDSPPYTDDLLYLRGVVRQAHAALPDQEIPGQFIDGWLVTDIGTVDHVVALVLSEHVWSDIWLTHGTDQQRHMQLHHVLVELSR